MELEQYLKERVAPSTAKRYLREIEIFFLSSEEKNINPKNATYQQIMDYLGELRKKSKSDDVEARNMKRYIQ